MNENGLTHIRHNNGKFMFLANICEPEHRHIEIFIDFVIINL